MSAQLEIELNAENPLAAALNAGRFSILLEYTPGKDGDRGDAARGRVQALARKVKELDGVVGTALTDHLMGAADAQQEERGWEHAVTFRKTSGKPVLLHVSGRGRDQSAVAERLSRAAAQGVRNALAVTGHRTETHPAAKALGRIPPDERGYVDSAGILYMLNRAERTPWYTGAAVNPFKYNPPDLLAQYFKAVRKLASGADFLVAQIGWDMAKLQELQWFLQMREFNVPVLARVALLRGEEVAGLPESLPPGVPMSLSLAAQFQREFTVNETQSHVAQIKRIALFAAGCRLLGYNGIQLAGVRDPSTLETLVRHSQQAFRDFKTYNTWRDAWLDHHAGVEFAPLPRPFYFFRNLLGDQPMFDETTSVRQTAELPVPTVRERLRTRLLGIVFSACPPGRTRNTLTRFLCRACRDTDAELRKCEFLCRSQCPKRLVYGPCGSGRPDGTCEFGTGPCFFQRVVAVANARKHLDYLESPVDDD